jgi:hypothetical protein
VIRYALQCHKGHGFESWFSGSASYESQARRGLVTCPVCGSAKVEKAIMAPALKRTDRMRRQAPPAAESEPAAAVPAPEVPTPVAMISAEEREFRSKLKELHEHIAKTAENVGPRFPEEARKMHYGEADHRSIYGQASPDEAKELLDEGIEFHPIPSLPEDRN